MAAKGKRTRHRQASSVKAPPKRSDAPVQWASERSAAIGVAAIFLIHTFGLLYLFDPLSGLLNPRPLLDQDWGLHFHHLKSLEAFWQLDKSLWGYNPFFMAGYPSNTIQDLSIKLIEILALALSWAGLTVIQWFKILVFLATASVPWLLYFSARNLFDRGHLQTVAAPVAALLGTAYWWNSLPREMFFYGMVGYPLACYLATLGVSLFYRMAQEPSVWSPAHIGWMIFGLIIPALHVQSVVIVLPPILALLIFRPDLFRFRLVAWASGSAAISLLVNLAWLAPAFSHRGDEISSSLVAQLPIFMSNDPLTFLKDYLAPHGYWSFRPTFWEKGLRLMLLLLACMGIVKLLRGENKRLAMAWTAGLVSLFVIAYFGSLIPALRGWQPLRFKVPYDLFLIFPAAHLVASWLTRRLLPPGTRLIQTLVICGAAAFFLNLMTTEALDKMNLRTQTLPEIDAIADWIRSEAPSQARVLFEESGDESGFVYDGMYLSSFIPHWTGRQLIGGPINLYNDRHHFAEFHSGKFFKKDIATLSDEEIKNYFRLYNIGAVVAFHPESIRRLQSIAHLIVLDRTVGPVHLMKVNQPFTWFLKGDGELKATFNRIELAGVKGDELILKYHWSNRLRGTPAVKIFPYPVVDDPIPFIRIVDPPPAFVLKN